MEIESRDPIELWARMKQEYSEYLKEKDLLTQKKVNQQNLLRLEEKERREYCRHKTNEKGLRMTLDALEGEIKALLTVRDELAKDLVESSAAAAPPLTDKEKAVVKAVLLKEWKEDLVELLYKQYEKKMAKHMRSADRILSPDELEWDYILTKESSFAEIHNLLKKFIRWKQERIKELLQNQTDLSKELIHLVKTQGRRKSMKDIVDMRKNSHVYVDIKDYLDPPELQEKEKDSWEKKSKAKREVTNDIFDRAEKKTVISKRKKKNKLAEAKSYEEYLDILDKEMYNAYMIYEKQKEVYKKMSKSDKLVFTRS